MTGHPGGEWTGPVADEPVEYPVQASVDRFKGRVWDVRTDTVDIEGSVVDRDYVAHTGAVAVVALDEEERVYLLRQYRHPVGMAMFEVPAGLLDVIGEPPLFTAERELAEEAGLVAKQWNVLIDIATSPGGSSEAIRVYLAREVSERPGGRVETGEAEEINLPGCWVDLEEAVALVLDGSLGNPTTVMGILAAHAARRGDWARLRDADAPWPMFDHLVDAGRVRIDPVLH